MAFTNTDFPGRVFDTIDELETAIKESKRIESDLLSKKEDDEEVYSVTATIIPTPQHLLERRVIMLEQQIEKLSSTVSPGEEKKPSLNKDDLPIGMVLKGESKGSSYTLEILEKEYLCSTGEIVATLSAAAEEVSGNRRSGWAFWTDGKGTPIGEITGRFKKHELSDPFGALGV